MAVYKCIHNPRDKMHTRFDCDETRFDIKGESVYLTDDDALDLADNLLKHFGRNLQIDIVPAQVTHYTKVERSLG